MHTSIQHSGRWAAFTTLRKSRGHFIGALWLVGLCFQLFSAPSAHAQGIPPGCSGSAIGISLFTGVSDVHVGDTLLYSISVFNGLPGNPTSCDASNIVAWVTTPDGVSNRVTLVRTYLSHAQSDFYANIVSYVVRAQDILPDGTVRATADDTAIIYQNDTPSNGDAHQGVNTEVSLPCIGIVAQCVGSVGENGVITFTGSITNCGNNTLTNLTLTNFVNGVQVAVTLSTNRLPRGQVVSFSGSWVPANPCSPSTATLTAQGTDQTSSPKTMTASVSTTCSDVLTPGIRVTKSCPLQPVSPGQLLIFSGSVSNTGNVTLTNIIVVNNQPASNTFVFAIASLAPGAITNFTGSYLAPTNCSVADTLTARASSICGVPVTNSASATCPILTTPQIVVTAACPVAQVLPGGPLIYTGTVRNSGDITLTNVVVLSDRPAANTIVFAANTLAPGAIASFTNNLTVPANACSVNTIFSGRGRDICTLISVTNTVSTLCTVITSPSIGVTLVCPTVPVVTGGLITYTGFVTNSGNVTLNNVTVINTQAGTVLTVPSLAAHSSSNFTASFTAPADACSVSSTVNVSGSDNCTDAVVNNSASTTCTLTTTPLITISQNCPVSPVSPGDLFAYSGTVSNAGNITLTNVIVLNNVSGGTPVLAATTLAPGASVPFNGSYTAPTNCSSTSISTVTGRSICGVPVVNSVTSICAITTTPLLTITQNCPVGLVVPGGLFSYSGTVSNAGNIAITNIIVQNNVSGATLLLTNVALAPGAFTNFTGSYLTPTNCTSTSTSTTTGRSVCGIAVTNSVTSICAITTTPLLTITQNCPVSPVSPGGLFAYSGTVSNAGNITITNLVVLNNVSGVAPILAVTTLSPHTFTTFTGSYTAPTNCSSTSISTVTGQSVCGVAVTNAVTSTCAISTVPLLTITQNCPIDTVIPGGLFVYSGTVSNAGNITLTNIVVLNNVSGATPLLTNVTLVPGASTNFTGNYLTPAACSTTSTSTTTGRSVCGIAVTNTVTSICAIITTPLLTITQNCPVSPVAPGGLFAYSGTVSNAGNITLTNVIVLNNVSGATPVLAATTLAPGAFANYTGNYLAPTNCSSTSISTVTGRSICGIAATNAVTSICAITTTPLVTITQNCPVSPVIPGGLFTYSGTVSNAGNITLTNIIVLNDVSGVTPLLVNVTLSPHTSTNFTGNYLAPTNCSSPSISTVTGQSVCGVAITNAVTSTCAITTVPLLSITQNCPVSPVIPGGLFTYSGTVSNAGNITLTNLVVLNNVSGATPLLTNVTLTPGASTNFTGSYSTPAACSTTSTSTATGRSVCGIAVTNTVTSICAITTTPLLTITQNCPVSPVSPGGLFAYSGTVSNAGNITLTNVIVLNNVSGGTPVLAATTLAPGASVNFTGNYLAPTNCSSTSISTATGRSICGVAVTNAVTSTCAITTTPLLTITQNCPVSPVSPGGLFAYSGTVSNAGNITITNIMVLNNVSGATLLLTNVTLSPHTSTNFTGNYLAPTNCSSTSTSTTTGQSICGVAVTNTVTSTCAIVTTPLLTITQNCPVSPVSPGGLFAYSGTVSNAGNITLTNVIVLNNVSGGTPVLAATTLVPGQAVTYNGSYTAPTNCTSTSISTATGRSVCGIAVTNSVTSFCAILTSPAIVVTQTCPNTAVLPGGILTYTGTVRNAGNITLTNIIVVSDRPADNTVIFTATSLAPGATTNFSGSYQVPPNCCVVSSTVRASGQGCAGVTVTDSATRTCIVFTVPKIVVTKICTSGVLHVGDLLTYSGIVSNAGNITLVNVSVANNQTPGSPPVPGPIILAPGESFNYNASYVVPPDFCGNDLVTASGLDVCTFLPVTNGVTTTCPVTTAPRIAVTKNCPVQPTPRGGLFTFTGSVSNPGNVTLINVFVVDNQPSNNTPVIGPLTLAPGASVNFTNSYIAPHCCCLMIDTLTARGQDRCSASNVTATATAVCPLLSSPRITVTKVCPPTNVPTGGLFTYSGSVSNAGDVVLTNVTVVSSQPNANTIVLGPLELAPGETKTFSGSYTIATNSNQATDTVTASGTDTCSGQTVTAMANCFGPVGQLIITAITLSDSIATVTWTATPGVDYTLQYKSNMVNASWTSVPGNVTAAGNTASKNDAVGSVPQRFYRVIVAP